MTDPIKADFRNFVWMAWQALGLPEPAPIQYDVATYISEGPERRMIQAMRGFGKSYLTATYAAWRLYCDPDTTMLCLSATGNRSREFIRLTRQLVASLDVCAHMQPREGNRDGADRFDVGNRTNIVQANLSAQQGLTEQLEAVQQSESGVNLDEEAANLIRYQQFYQANAKVIQTGSTIMDAILGLR